jgi:hypothetical protein
MDNGLGADYSVIYDGVNAPSLTSFNVAGVTPGHLYRLRLAARVFNGLGPTSAVAEIYACTAPSGLAVPALSSMDSTSMTLTWTEPTSNGACPLTGYALYVDDGTTGAPTTLVSGMSTDVPTLRSVTVALLVGDLGTTYTFQLSVSNREGTAQSSLVTYLFAIPPVQPSAGPVILSTSATSISVRYDADLPSGSGSPETSYHLQYMGAYTIGLWRDLVGHDIDSLLTSYTLINITKGETYFFRYRVKNVIGWSPYSAETSSVAADAPSKPATPLSVVGDATASSVTLQFDLETVDDNGSPITSYRLERCLENVAETNCLSDSQFTVETSYASTA